MDRIQSLLDASDFYAGTNRKKAMSESEKESEKESENPFTPPTNPYKSLVQNRGIDSPETQEKIKKFREQMLALGILWVFVGLLAIGVSLMTFYQFPDEGDHPAMFSLKIVLVLGALWFVLGIATLFKVIGAVYVGLVISYLSLLSNMLTLNICGTIVVILQAHRVIKWAGDFREMNIPLNSKPY